MIIRDLLKEQSLTDSEQVLAHYIAEHYQKVMHMTSRELATATFVSASTVVRLCKKLGFDSFTAFKVALSKEATDEYFKFNFVDYNYPLTPQSTEQEIAENMASLAIASILRSRNQFDYATVRKVSRTLSQNKNIDFYARGHSMNASREFIEKLNHIGYIVTPIETGDSSMFRALGSGKNQIAFLVSYSGLNPSDLSVIQTLKKRHTPTVFITANRRSPLIKYATYVLYIDSDEMLTHAHKIEFFGSLYSLHYLFDCLYSQIFVADYEENLQKIEVLSSIQVQLDSNSNEG